MEFTAEQQTFIDGLIKDAYTKAFTKAQANMTDDIATAVTKAETKFQSKLTASEKKVQELELAVASKNNTDNTAYNERIAKIEGKFKKAAERASKGDLESAAAKFNAVNPSQAAVLLRAHTVTDEDGNLTVINADGKPRNDESNKPMTLEALAAEFLKANPHLVNASGSAGSGSGGNTDLTSGAANTIKRADFMKLPPAEQMAKARVPGFVVTD